MKYGPDYRPYFILCDFLNSHHSNSFPIPDAMGVWHGVAVDYLKFHSGPPCPTFLRPAGGPPVKRPHGRFRGGPLQGGQLAAVLYPFCHPKPYTSDTSRSCLTSSFLPVATSPVVAPRYHGDHVCWPRAGIVTVSGSEGVPWQRPHSKPEIGDLGMKLNHRN
jgi:hypothetical protein